METLKKLWVILSKRQRIKYIVLFFLQWVASLLELLGVSTLVPFMESVMNPNELMNKDIIKRVVSLFNIVDIRGLIVLLLVVIILVYVIKNAYLTLLAYLQARFIYNDKKVIMKTLLDYYAYLDYEYHINHNSAEIQRIILVDADYVFALLQETSFLFSEVITAIFLAGYLFYSSKSITIGVILLMLLFMFLHFKKFKKKLLEYANIFQKSNSDSIRNVKQLFEGIKEIKVRNVEQSFIKKIEEILSIQFSAAKKSKFIQIAPKYLLETMAICGILGILLIKILMGADITAMVTQLTVFAVAAYRLMPAVNRISLGISSIYSYTPSVGIIYDAVVDMRASNLEKKKKESDNDIYCENEKVISLKNISFRYPQSDKYILDNVSFEIDRNTSIGFKGPSGSGKTTTVDIILGLLKPEQGYVLYYGKDIKNLEKEWNNKIGYIPQNICLSDDTIRNNIVYGKAYDDEKVWAALEEAQLKEFVESTKEKLDLVVGEGGVRLSGGQRQRIGIARALYNNPDIIIMDEATSALDNDTEAAVMESIDHLKGRKTLIIIAHRLSTIEKCDHIYEVKDGKIVESK